MLNSLYFRAFRIIGNETRESALECQEWCQEHDYCRFFSFNRVSHDCLVQSTHHRFAAHVGTGFYTNNVGIGFYNITWVTGPKFCDNCA